MAENNIDDLTNCFLTLRVQPDTKTVRKNPQILMDLLSVPECRPPDSWTPVDYNASSVYKLVRLDSYSSECQNIRCQFSSSMHHRKSYTVDYIDRVENPFLFAQYQLKKMQKRQKHVVCEERELFHGTKLVNVDPICKENFNWRLTGTCVGHRFGQGISFSPSSTYSCHYPRNYPYTPRVMFLSNVLIASSCTGNALMKIPTGSCDTSTKPDGNVIVKYEDNDFYPKYVIYYS